MHAKAHLVVSFLTHKGVSLVQYHIVESKEREYLLSVFQEQVVESHIPSFHHEGGMREHKFLVLLGSLLRVVIINHSRYQSPFSAIFGNHIREEIRHIIVSDFGYYEWECLYVEHENENNDLATALQIQKKLIEEKYGACNVKDNFIMESTIEILSKN